MTPSRLKGAALRDETLAFDRADFVPLLLDLRTALRDLVVVEIARDAIGFAVKEIDQRSEKIGQVGFETRIGKEVRQGLDDGFESERRGVRGGQGTWIGIVLEKPLPVLREFIKKMGGCRPRGVMRLDEF